MPYYTQYDSRWASLRLGSSNVRNIGCTVTCTAMSESYRTGAAVTPATIVRTNSFTPGGALYGRRTTHATPAPTGSPYAYRQLAAGKPVIFHGQKWSGTSHWVIIYGYTGGQTLSAENFPSFATPHRPDAPLLLSISSFIPLM